MLKFGAWKPDLGERDTPMLTVSNCIPVNKLYKQFKAVSTSGAALAAIPVGAFHAFGPSGSAYVYAGTPAGLFQAGTSSWTDQSKSGGYSLSGESLWRFTQYGTKVLAVSLNENTQIATIGGKFADVTSTWPRGNTIGVIRNFVVVGDIMTESGHIPNGTQWSAIDDPTDWPVPLTLDALSKQSGRQTHNARYGAVNFIGNGERFGTVLQERGVTRAQYIGGDAVFQYDTFEKTHGADTKGGNVQIDDVIYFLSEEGFYSTDGNTISNIGHDQTNQTFLADYNRDKRHLVTAAADTDDKIIYWSYPSASSSVPDKIIAYSYADKRWSDITVACDMIVSSVSLATTLEDLDSQFATLELVTPSMDSPVWQGGDQQVAVIGTDEKLGTFTGSALTAVIETGEFAANPGGRAIIRAIHPVVEGGTVSISCGARNSLNATRRYSASRRTHEITGWAPFVSNARWQTIKTTISGGFTSAEGADIQLSNTGI